MLSRDVDAIRCPLFILPLLFGVLNKVPSQQATGELQRDTVCGVRCDVVIDRTSDRTAQGVTPCAVLFRLALDGFAI